MHLSCLKPRQLFDTYSTLDSVIKGPVYKT